MFTSIILFSVQASYIAPLIAFLRAWTKRLFGAELDIMLYGMRKERDMEGQEGKKKLMMRSCNYLGRTSVQEAGY